ncbi:MAG: hypothetical protein AAGI14_11910 [Pseudomonadota bacterium]
MKLFTIGDSISQGFMSGAAARTDLSYSTLIAKSLGLNPGTDPQKHDYLYPEWPMDGLPVNLEALARKLKSNIGDKIDFWDWPRFLNTVRRYIDSVEDYYERGDGRITKPFGTASTFNNMAIQGYDVADTWLVTPKLCRQFIEKANEKEGGDEFGSLPSAFFYRTALNVLNPQRDPDTEDWTVLDWLEHHVENEGVENVIVWLGANNALGTITRLEVKATNDNRVLKGKVKPVREIMESDISDYEKRRLRAENFNLWSPQDFAWEFGEFMARLSAIMAKNKHNNWNVFLATVPAITIAPLAKGVGGAIYADDPFDIINHVEVPGIDGAIESVQAKYFKHYTYFLFDADFAQKNDCKLTFSQVYAIDKYISSYRDTIKAIAKAYNHDQDRERYHVVDTCEALLKAAFKRNDRGPTYEWPDEVLTKFPMIDTRFHHATSRGNLEQGGIFSMDGIHPSALGQGLIAHEFIKTMKQVLPEGEIQEEIDWDAIYKSDNLFISPISLMESIRAKAGDVGRFVMWLSKLKGRM